MPTGLAELPENTQRVSNRVEVQRASFASLVLAVLFVLGPCHRYLRATCVLLWFMQRCVCGTGQSRCLLIPSKCHTQVSAPGVAGSSECPAAPNERQVRACVSLMVCKDARVFVTGGWASCGNVHSLKPSAPLRTAVPEL